MKEFGVVYLVGAGPGDPGLMTVRGLELLRRADAVLYDALANPELLDEAPAHAERIHVGKRSGDHYMPQTEISELLYVQAQKHATVIRLKGGDPYIFGRGSEEEEYLQERGVRVEVVPGVTSATAAAAAAGISLTRRGVSSTFAVVTGRQAHDASFTPAWSALAQLESVVVMMGVATAGTIANALMAGGREGATPVALVANATLPNQRVLITRLDALGATAAAFADEDPVTIIIGEVAAYGDAALAAMPTGVDAHGGAG